MLRFILHSTDHRIPADTIFVECDIPDGKKSLAWLWHRNDTEWYGDYMTYDAEHGSFDDVLGVLLQQRHKTKERLDV